MIEINGRYFMPHDFEYELWETIADYPNYMISNFSRIKRKPTTNDNTMIMKPCVYDRRDMKYNKENKSEYFMYVMLTKDGKQFKVNIADLIVKTKFKNIVKIKLSEDEQFVRYDKNAEYIYNAF